MLDVATAHKSSKGILIAGLAGLVAGALSMGVGEHASRWSSQLARCRRP